MPAAHGDEMSFDNGLVHGKDSHLQVLAGGSWCTARSAPRGTARSA